MEIKINLVTVLTISDHLSRDHRGHCTLCPFVLSIVSTRVMLPKSPVTGLLAESHLRRTAGSSVYSDPVFPGKLRHDKPCYGLRRCLLRLSIHPVFVFS